MLRHETSSAHRYLMQRGLPLSGTVSKQPWPSISREGKGLRAFSARSRLPRLSAASASAGSGWMTDIKPALLGLVHAALPALAQVFHEIRQRVPACKASEIPLTCVL